MPSVCRGLPSSLASVVPFDDKGTGGPSAGNNSLIDNNDFVAEYNFEKRQRVQPPPAPVPRRKQQNKESPGWVSYSQAILEKASREHS